ncbi:class I SAM-dependent methyltransferase [Ferruginibacter sp.]|uniref:class I SAM-dependent methyltransferase n=1 Tax=Ferruginibacter sp. TaxID=1940288 RepID=UPI00265895A2|nr:class I SAM-dependent methyltransferase [Ferruginibacter sp.]
MNKKQHWETVFTSKKIDEVSWYQQTPQDSINFIEQLELPNTAAIIDVGGGDSFLADYLVDKGYSNITVLDISSAAIKRAKQRLGRKAAKVKWIVADVLEFTDTIKYDCWHDRAAFHFFTKEDEVKSYLSIAQQHLNTYGKLIIGTFSTDGPEKCSSLPVKRYNENLLTSALQHWFTKINCVTTNHTTPFKTVQNFLFCSFKKLST